MAVVTMIVPDRFGWRIKFSDRTSFYIDNLYCAKDQLPKEGDSRDEVVEKWNPIHAEYFYTCGGITFYSSFRGHQYSHNLKDIPELEINKIAMAVAAKYKEISQSKPSKVRSEVIQRYGCNLYPKDFKPTINEIIMQELDKLKQRNPDKPIEPIYSPTIGNEYPEPTKRIRKRIPVKVVTGGI